MGKYLVSGASGFLGSELIPRLLLQGIEVRAMARNEGKLIELKEKYPSIEIMTGDVSNICDVRQAVAGVDSILHLAAFKMVGMAEDQPTQCVRSNVIGSLNILEATDQKKYDNILFVSTDKSCKVAGVYGATKLLMERMAYQYSLTNPQSKYRTVRYGNILYSTSSVLVKWKKNLLEGKEIVVTDLQATRYFWTVSQAVNLIFECLNNATDARPYCPQMRSVSVGELLFAMENKYGKAVSIKTIGLQAGENLHEQITEDGLTSDKAERYSYEELYNLI